MSIKDFLSKVLAMFPDFRKRTEALGDTESSSFFKSMLDSQIDEAIRGGEMYVNNVSLIREHQRMLKKENILDPFDEQYKDLDPRSLNVMLEEMFELDLRIIGGLKLEQKRRDDIIQQKAREEAEKDKK